MTINEIWEFLFTPQGFFTVFAGMFAVSVLLRVLSMRKRREALRSLSMQMGLSYEEKATPFDQPAETATGASLAASPQLTMVPNHLYFFGREHRNVMRGSTGGMEAVVFDARTRSGKNTRESTHVALRAGMNALPDFYLMPEIRFFGFDISELGLGMKDIDFPQYPEFSKRWWLYATDEAAVRRLFERGAIQTFENLEPDKKYSIQSADGWLFFTHWRPGFLKPELIREFFDDAGRLGSALRQAGRTSAGM